jgi:eukaryotic-like serine/threonine-protein kinase
MNEESLFQEVLCRSPAERAAFLERACAGRHELRAAVEALLAAHERSGNVLDEAAVAPSGTAVSGLGPVGWPLAGQYTPQPEDAAPPLASTTDYRPDRQLGAIIADRYTLVEKIGEGGMGEVWVAKQTEPIKRKVALKLIKSGMDTKAVLQRFEAERQALALMDHPNIARVLDGGMTDDRRPFFVMELVNGLPLTKFCDEAKLGIRERLELFVGICQAVQHAHQKGIIHRDLKPSNILVTLIDARPVPKVIDFGVAKAIGGKLLDASLSTQFGAVVGTLEYMAPEQAGYSGTDVDTRADIYSLGVILYELLTGLRPIDSNRLRKAALTEMIRIIQEEEPSKPSTRLSTDKSLLSLAALRRMEPRKLMAILRGELDWVVMKCLEKDRARRYETANGFAMDIQRYLAGEPVLAVPPSAGYRLRKLVRRNKGPALAAAAVGVAIVAGVAAVLVVQARANRELAGTIEKLAAKNIELAEEQAKVEKRFELAQKAIAKLHTGVSEDLLLKSDQFKELRNQLLKEAADFYGDMEKLLEGEADAKSRRLLAAGYFQLAELTGNIGSASEALTVHRKALAVRRELAAAPGADVETRLDVARSLGAMGILLSASDLEGALRAFSEERDISAALAAESSQDTVLAVLGRCLTNFGTALWRQGKMTEALEAEEKAAAILRKLIEANPKDTELQYDLASSLFRAAACLANLGKWAESAAVEGDTRTIMEKLVKDHPHVTRFQQQLGLIYYNISAHLYFKGRAAETLAYLEKSLHITITLAYAHPAVTEFQRSLLWIHTGFGDSFLDIGMLAEAMVSYEKGLNIARNLAQANPSDLWVKWRFADSYAGIGEVYARMGKPGEALQSHEKARALLMEAPESNSAFAYLQGELAGSLDKIGLLKSVSGKPTEALESCKKALAIRKKLSDAQPAVVFFRADVADSLSSLGTVQRRAGRPAEAVDSFRRAIELVEQLPTPTPRNRYSLACCHAQLAGVAGDPGSGMTAAQGKAEAEQAMNLLQQAIAGGYEGIGRLRTDASLHALRSRDDFQKLVKELETKVAKMLKVAPRS